MPRVLLGPTALASVFILGSLVGLVSSAGIVEERFTAGSPSVAFGVNAAISGSAILVLALARRRLLLSPEVVVSQLLGAAVGVLLVHQVVRAGVVPTPCWLAERSPQLVNDAVAALSTLLLVWACARRLDLRVLVGALLLVTAYRSTAGLWHLDVPPHGFALRVQDIVIAQFVGAALAVALYRHMTRVRRVGRRAGG